jgi:hypothetical protein
MPKKFKSSFLGVSSSWHLTQDVIDKMLAAIIFRLDWRGVCACEVAHSHDRVIDACWETSFPCHMDVSKELLWYVHDVTAGFP